MKLDDFVKLLKIAYLQILNSWHPICFRHKVKKYEIAKNLISTSLSSKDLYPDVEKGSISMNVCAF